MAVLVPTVDLGPYVDGGGPARRAATAAALDVACREVGFLQVVGHGVPAAAAADLAAAMDAFFALPPAAKLALRCPPEVNRGYTAPRSEAVSLSLGVADAGRMNDAFEAFNVGSSRADHPDADLDEAHHPANVWPDVPGFADAVGAWFGEAARVARVLTRVFADALGVPTEVFASVTRHPVEVLRMNHYALPEGTPVDGSRNGSLNGMGAHTDYGLVTVLWADPVPGLQLLGPDRAWHDVQPADGALLVNLGDLTARLTNERWLSTLHRVRPPVVDGVVQRRRSAAFFHDGDVDAVIAPLPSCVPAGERPRYAPITVADHLAAKLAGSRAGRANAGAGREAARVLAARPG